MLNARVFILLFTDGKRAVSVVAAVVVVVAAVVVDKLHKYLKTSKDTTGVSEITGIHQTNQTL